MWKNGIGAAHTEPSSSPMPACSSRRAQPRLRPVSSTPLGSPVVPEVYRISAVSSGPAVRRGRPPERRRGGPRNCRRLARRSPVHEHGAREAEPSAAPASQACLLRHHHPRLGVGQDGHDLLSRQPIVDRVKIAPHLAVAYMTSANAGPLAPMNTTRSPGPTPAARRADAARLDPGVDLGERGDRPARDSATPVGGGGGPLPDDLGQRGHRGAVGVVGPGFAVDHFPLAALLPVLPGQNYNKRSESMRLRTRSGPRARDVVKGWCPA